MPLEGTKKSNKRKAALKLGPAKAGLPSFHRCLGWAQNSQRPEILADSLCPSSSVNGYTRLPFNGKEKQALLGLKQGNVLWAWIL